MLFRSTAPNFKGPYTVVANGDNLLPDNNELEDPTIWWAHDQYNILLNDWKGKATGTGKAGVLTWVLSYAFSKAFEANHRLNDWNINEPVIKEIDNTDKAQNLTFSGVWDLPFGHDRRMLNVNNKVARVLADNWRLTPILSYSSGNPTGMPNLINTCGDWHAKPGGFSTTW